MPGLRLQHCSQKFVSWFELNNLGDHEGYYFILFKLPLLYNEMTRVHDKCEGKACQILRIKQPLHFCPNIYFRKSLLT